MGRIRRGMIPARDQFPSHARLRRPAQRHGRRQRGQLPARHHHHQEGQEEERVDSAPDHKFSVFMSGYERCGLDHARGQRDVPYRRPDHGPGRADDRCGWHVERAGRVHDFGGGVATSARNDAGRDNVRGVSCDLVALVRHPKSSSRQPILQNRKSALGFRA
jgi:hypothetical protein